MLVYKKEDRLSIQQVRQSAYYLKYHSQVTQQVVRQYMQDRTKIDTSVSMVGLPKPQPEHLPLFKYFSWNYTVIKHAL